jgi:large subunit ribosomal protein L18e
MATITKSKIKFRTKKKSNPELEATIYSALKHTEWAKIASILSGPSRAHSALNLYQIDKHAKAGDIVIVPGKILSEGNVSKKVKICALSISKLAKEKLKESKSEFATILDEIKKNPKAEGVKLLR